uniref:Reverse transcriptase domain-containing protein n=1 Tax=Myripristis murdjan TaxID=586833 RepID=A0A667X5D4_9TELE
MMGTLIKVISWNVNGICNKVKQYKIISHLKSLACDIAMIQEHHMNEIESLKLKQRWIGQVFTAPGNGAARGTSILVSKKISFHPTEIITDKNGRYVIVSGFLQHKKITLVNVYAPNYGQVEFLANLSTLLSNGHSQQTVLSPLPLMNYEKVLGVTDVWRCVNPLSREYTFFSQVHNSYSRIDYVLNNSVLPKPNKDHSQMGNFRPLSLLNNDYKIFAKALALCLEKVISSLVHLDQVGFIAGRHASHNMRRLFHVMSEAASLYYPHPVAISLDAEKALDQIEWSYLFHVLSNFGFGPTCLRWIKALYDNPVACVKTNGLISSPFQLFRSTRQGCLVSPVIFTLALEPLACAIRASYNITGIPLFKYDFKVNLYADDILLTLSRPDHSIPHLMKLINDFGLFSGYKVNRSKSEAIPLNPIANPSHVISAPIVWKSQGMRYLGVNIVSPTDKIFELNGPKLLKSIKEDLKIWTSLLLSLWGRAEILKMNTLPRIAFIFSGLESYPNEDSLQNIYYTI